MCSVEGEVKSFTEILLTSDSAGETMLEMHNKPLNMASPATAGPMRGLLQETGQNGDYNGNSNTGSNNGQRNGERNAGSLNGGANGNGNKSSLNGSDNGCVVRFRCLLACPVMCRRNTYTHAL